MKCVKLMMICICVGLSAGLSYGQTDATADSSSSGSGKGFRYPAYDHDGSLKYEILGTKASQNANGSVSVAGVRIEVYDQGKVDTVITADSCVYNQESRHVEGEGSVKISRDGMTITGDKLKWDGNTKQLELTDNVKVVMAQARLGQLTPGGAAKKAAP
jgi:LPS export ABC transporter protein LptC